MKIKNIDVPFAQVANQVLNDNRLSWKAKGVFAYIQSKPEYWDFSSDRMALDSTDGRKSTLAGINELIDNGYLTRTRNGDGTIDMELKLPEPQCPKGDEDPQSPNATVPFGHGAQKATISNKDSLVTKNSKNKEAQQLPPWMDPAIWAEWEQHRKEIKKKLTPLTVTKQINLLAKNIPIYKLVVEQSIRNGWAGLFPEKIDRKMIEEANIERRDKDRRAQPAEDYPELTPEQIETNRKRLREIKEGSLQIGAIKK